MARARAGVLAAAASLLLSAGPVAAQCTVGTLAQFSPPGPITGYGPSGKFKPGYLSSFDLFTYPGGAKRLVAQENYGYTVYDITTPTQPSVEAFCDLEATYHKSGDGFSTVFSVGASPDGSRLGVSYIETHNVLLLTNPNGSGCFILGGEFADSRAANATIVPIKGRYMAFSASAMSTFWIADATTVPPDPADILPEAVIPGAPTAFGTTQLTLGTYQVYVGGGSVAVVDTAGLGTTGFTGTSLRVYSPADFGFPATDSIVRVAGAIHPVSWKVYLMVQALTFASSSDGYALGTIDPGTGALVGVTRTTTPYPWVASGALAGVATANDVVFFAWALQQTTPMKNKLFTYSAAAFGTDLTPNAYFDGGNYPSTCATNSTTCQFNGTVYARALAGSQNQITLYTSSAKAGYALPLTCVTGSTLAATASASPVTAGVGQSVQFNGGASGGSAPYALSWNFGDGGTGAGSSPGHSFAAPGTYTAVLTVTDNANVTATAQVVVTVPLPPVTISAPASLCASTVGDASTADAGVGASYQWTVTNGTLIGGQGTRFLQFGTGATGSTTIGVSVQTAGGTAGGSTSVTAANCTAPVYFYPVTPCRVLDTRLADGPLAGPTLPANGLRNFTVAGVCGIPANAAAIAANVTVAQPSASGDLRLFPGDGVTPLATSSSFTAGKVRANNVMVRLSSDGLGQIRVQNASAGTTDVVLDVSGYFAP